jgi:mannose-1-phosphate guanylyltransferase/mannose-6-phosphate isomerase
MEYSKYTILDSDTIIEALKRIDLNKKGFLIVVDDEMILRGTLTDGDIRRALIAGISLNDKVQDVHKKECTFMYDTDDMTASIDLFKSGKIKFLPIVDKENKLKNIITKSQLHALLLQDIHADLLYDFQTLDDTIIDHEIFQRPWGFYKTTLMNDYCQSKIICVYPKAQLSLQSHSHREEHWIVAHGIGTVQIENSVFQASCGSVFFIPKGSKHRLINTDEKETLVLSEVQIGDYFGEDDIHRYEDIYGRI